MKPHHPSQAHVRFQLCSVDTHSLSDEQGLTETWTRSQITMNLMQNSPDSLVVSFYHPTIQVPTPTGCHIGQLSVSLPGQISLGFLLI